MAAIFITPENPEAFWAAINGPGPSGGPFYREFLYGWTEDSSADLKPGDAAELLAFCEAQPGWSDGPEGAPYPLIGLGTRTTRDTAIFVTTTGHRYTDRDALSALVGPDAVVHRHRFYGGHSLCLAVTMRDTVYPSQRVDRLNQILIDLKLAGLQVVRRGHNYNDGTVPSLLVVDTVRREVAS